MYSVAAVVVTYNPEAEVLNALLKAIEQQVAYIIVVDNGSKEQAIENIRQAIPENGQLIEKGYNSGISGAINTGVIAAENFNATHIVLFDQDSIPGLDMVEKLLLAMNDKREEGANVAAVGPKYSDIKGDHVSPFVKLVGWRLQRVDCGDDEIVAVDHLISSGCLISMEALYEVGGMEQKLFIDYVDIEWSLRAINRGYSLFGVGAARMQHDLGDELVSVLGRTIPLHSSLRYYYLIRNGVWVLLQPWVSQDWKKMDLIRLCKIYVVFSLFAGTKFDNWKMMSKGILHAIKGRMGKC